MRSANVGRNTLCAALNTVRYISELFEVPQEATSLTTLFKLASDYRDGGKKEVARAKAFSRRLLLWLEATVLNEAASPCDRLVAGRLRMAASASMRAEDGRRTPFHRMEWVLH
eukprot:9892817-Heterocapsa_arctica.AAC.1